MPTKWKVHKHPNTARSDSRHTTYDYKRRNDEELGPISEFRGSIRWQRVRTTQVQKYPLCYDPFKNHEREGLPALCQSVHHIISLLECLHLGVLERLGSTPDNLRSLCSDCHNKVEGVYDRMGEVEAKRIFITAEEEYEIKSLVI